MDNTHGGKRKARMGGGEGWAYALQPITYMPYVAMHWRRLAVAQRL